MTERRFFKCSRCGREAGTIDPQAPPPSCCDAPMDDVGALPQCRLSGTSEHSRMDVMEEPCDDGRDG